MRKQNDGGMSRDRASLEEGPLANTGISFPGGASGKEPACQCRRCKKPGFDPLEEGRATCFQYSCLENPMDRGAWQAVAHGVTKSQT